MTVFRTPRRGGGKAAWLLLIPIGIAVAAGLGGAIIGACSIVGGDDPLTGLGDLVGLDDDVETRAIEGDARRFDPFRGLAAAQAFAGEGARLVEIGVALVRADGTMDLKASFTPRPDTTYTFVREVPRPASAPPPGAGGANIGPWHETIKIRAYEPGQTRQRTTTEGGIQRTVRYENKGFDLTTEPATSGPVTYLEAPSCKIAAFFAEATKLSAPADAVARITYDAAGYEFTITGLRISIEFDAACALRP